MWYSTDLGLIQTPKAIRIGDINYPANIFNLWSKADLAAINIKPARITAVDARYASTGGITWDTSGAEAIGTYSTTNYSIADLKKQRKAEINQIAASLLTPTDWMVIREAEGGTAEPADWKTWRASIRTTANTKITEVDALANLAALKTYDTNYPVSKGWPVDPDDPSYTP
tara:strand:- start:49 stop:561 length:513 start_codon:yes stop_codon:yes gene_type:complete